MKKKTISFNRAKLGAMMVELIDHAQRTILPAAVGFALDAQHPDLGAQQMDALKKGIKDLSVSMNPLNKVIADEVTRIVMTAFSETYGDKEMANYFQKRSAAALGKKGGIPKGKRAAHLDWLDKAMRRNGAEENYAVEGLTAREHFNKLRNHDDIRGENECGALEFEDAIADYFSAKDGRDPPAISMDMVRRALTKIRKQK